MPRFEVLQVAFWDGSSNYGVQPPLTDQLVDQAELTLEVTIPASLVALLHQQNGGRVAAGLRAFPTSVPTSWASDHVPFEYMMGIGHRTGAPSLLDSVYLIGEWDLPDSLILLSGDGPCWIGLDYRTGPTPTVGWFDADSGLELPLAASFQDFVEGLTDPETYG
ncbi:SMI1/KNR4 family protein [Streptomyces aculeolatus]|uniref:SMI1/KNR4 family protein n=1 Tax=Streptomyces aculeolatus TaxID=270689 RepID=UPI001CED8C1D|nr:SMI1/KNR4 family protein [Streptomyces aculeolatus]